MGSEVYFSQRRATPGGGLLEKLEQLCEAAGFSRLASPGDEVAVLASFAEPGNTAYARPAIVERLTRRLVALGARPFLTDTVALPPSVRRSGSAVLAAAAAHGFLSLRADLETVVADGEGGGDDVCLTLPERENLGGAWVAGGIARASGLLVVSHVTCHEWWGFAGALVRLGYGAASLRGKERIKGLEQSNDTLLKNAELNQARTLHLIQSAATVAAHKVGRVGYVNLLLDITPEDDDRSWSDAPIVPDIGILVSRDPVAIDQATVDLLQQAPGIAGTRLPDPLTRDKLRAVHPTVDWEGQLRLAEEFSLGHRDYELMIV